MYFGAVLAYIDGIEGACLLCFTGLSLFLKISLNLIFHPCCCISTDDTTMSINDNLDLGP